jgi:16S rRNA (guanine966-N2)-methyltransferase
MPRNNRTGLRAGRIADATSDLAAKSRGRGARLPGQRGEVRIIGGEWRGRKLHFPQAATLRPTPDRVRETVFNWLQFELAGKRCLDLFAGSGALGFEALSRGASEVVFVERDPPAAAAIRDSLRLLRCDRGRLESRDAFAYLAQGPAQPFDIVFVDPPYAERWLARTCTALESGGWLQPDAWVYLEDAAAHGLSAVPPGWALLRSKKAGDVGYHLARRGRAPMFANDAEQEGSA